MRNFFEIIQQEMAAERPISLVSVVAIKGSAPQRVGAKMLVSSSGKLLWGTIGGGTVEALALEQAKTQIESRTPLLKTFELLESGEEATGMLCGGEMQLFFDVYGVTTKVYIFGAGHITQQILPLLVKLGFSPVVIDDREEYLEENIVSRFNVATHSGDFLEVIDSLFIERDSYIIIMTYSHDIDERILFHLLSHKLPDLSTVKYLGMIGSKRKVKEIFSRVESKGVSREKLSSIHSPIGVPIKSQTPEEIAISIAAELISVRNKEVK
jgi:xanthine dehydrogenase accessory factor